MLKRSHLHSMRNQVDVYVTAVGHIVHAIDGQADAIDGDRPFIGHVSGELLRHFRSEEHTSELQSLMRISYAVFCLKNKNIILLSGAAHIYKKQSVDLYKVRKS